MGLNDWFAETRRRFDRDPVRTAAAESAYRLYTGGLGRFRSLRPGTPVYEREWDALVILDACRYDLLAGAADEYAFLDRIETFDSVGSTSEEWMEHTFTDEYADEMAGTAYVSGNIYTESKLDGDDFERLDEVWRTGWNDELGTVEPRELTDAAIRCGRERSFERLIVHYMQPHYPFLTRPGLAPGMRSRDGEGNVWDRIRTGELDRGTVWKAYAENLRCVLDDVGLLLRNLDAGRVVISADHGNAFGEAGVYGHPYGVPLRCLRRVPWAVTSAEDTGEYEPAAGARDRGARSSVEEKLSALGYVE